MKCCRILTANSENKFFSGILPSRCLSQQANKISNETSYSLFPEMIVESPVFKFPAQSLINIFLTAYNVTQHQ